MKHTAVGGEDFECVVGVEAVFPAVEVEDVVVAAAEEYEVVGSGGAAEFPVENVVGFTPGGGPITVREPAVAIADV